MARMSVLAAIWLIFALNSESALASNAPSDTVKSASAVREPNKGAAIEDEVIARFERMVKKYQQFFSEPRLCYDKQSFSRSPTGFNYRPTKFMAVGNATYDIEKTNSLISPYVAHILMTLKVWRTEKCENLKGETLTPPLPIGDIFFGFDTLNAAKQAAMNASCFEVDARWTEVRFNCAFQRGKWVWKSAITTPKAMDAHYLSTALQHDVGSGDILEENKDWLILVEE